MGKTSQELERALRESQANLFALMENIDGPIWSVDRNYCFLIGNSAFQQDIEAVRGHPFAPGESVLADEFQAAANKWRGYYDLALRGERFTIEMPRVFLYVSRMVEYRFSPIRTADGAVVGVTVWGCDTTERKQAESRLQADQEALARTHTLLNLPLETTGFHPILQEYIEAAVAFVSADKGTLQLLEGDSLRIVAHAGHQAPFLDFFAAAEQCASACGEVLRRGERVVVPDVEESPLFVGTPSLAVLRQAGVRAVLSVPMMSRTGRLHGVLTTHWAEPHTPDEHDLWQMDMLARQVANLAEIVQAEEENRELLAAVQQERDRLAALLNSISDEVWFADAEKNLTLVNPAVRREFGASVEAGATVEQIAASFEVYRPDGSPRPVDEAPPLRALRGEIVRNQQEIVKTPATGELRWREVNASPVRDASGAVMGSVSVVRDITERKRTEQSLQESEERYRMLFEHMSEGFFLAEIICDENGRPVDYRHLAANPMLERVTGMKPEELLGKTRREVTLPPSPWIEAFGQVALTGQPTAFEGFSAGLNRHYWITAYSPRPGQFACLVQDITARKQAEEAERESEMKYRLIVENAQEGIWTVNANRQTLYVNERMAEMLGYSVQEFMETPWTEMVCSVEERKGSDQRVQQRRQGGQRSRESYEMQFIRKDGSILWAIVNATPLFNEHGEYIGSTSMLSDVTRHKQVEQDLFAINQHLAALLKALPVGASYSDDPWLSS